MPKVHQSTALVCPQPLMTSGAMYSRIGVMHLDILVNVLIQTRLILFFFLPSVPTKLLVRRFVTQLRVSMAGG
jgi:hypothetical protein